MKPETTDRTVRVPDCLGRLGLSLAADILEQGADQISEHTFHTDSLQQVADWLRQVAVSVPKSAPMNDSTSAPCPFCGGALEVSKHFKESMWRAIHRCKVVGAIAFDWRESPEAIIKQWNRRA